MVKWEYTLIKAAEQFCLKDLNELGDDGWELVTTYKTKVGLLFIFKRAIGQ